MGDIRPGITDIPIHFSHDADMLVRVEEGELLIAAGGSGTATVSSAVGLQTGIGENDDETLGVLVVSRDGHVLLCDELGKLRRGTRLGPWVVVSISHRNYLGRLRWFISP